MRIFGSIWIPNFGNFHLKASISLDSIWMFSFGNRLLLTHRKLLPLTQFTSYRKLLNLLLKFSKLKS